MSALDFHIDARDGAARTGLAAGLELLGVDAPERI